MNIRKGIVLSTFFYFLFPVVLCADTIIFKSGNAVSGKIVNKTDQFVQFDCFYSGVVLTFSRDEIGEVRETQKTEASLDPGIQLIKNNENLKKALAKLLDTNHPATKNDVVIFPEDPRWPLLYYYRNFDEENLTAYLKTFLKNPALLKDSQTAAYTKHFFSTALKGKPQRIEEIKALGTALSVEASNWLNAIVQEAQQPGQAVPNIATAEDLDLLWADFRATGDSEKLRKIIALFTDPKTRADEVLLKKAETSLVINGLKNLDLKELLKTEIEKTDPQAALRLKGIQSILSDMTELSGNYLTRGRNEKRLNEKERAFKNYQMALQICSDYSIALMNMGTFYYYARRDEDNYYKFQKAALYVDPDESDAAYAIGIHFFNKGDQESAIRYYLKALEYEPEKPEYNHAVARAYQVKGDTANAIHYFQRYLTLAPHAEHEKLVRAYLKSVHAPLKVNPNDLNVMLERGRYDELETQLAVLLKANKKDEDGSAEFRKEINKLVAPKAMGVPLGDRLKLIEKWVKQRPNAHFANLVAGIFYIDYAWEARGAGFSKTVTSKGYRLYRERLEIAQKYLTKAYGLNPDDPWAPINLLTVARGQGLEFAEMEKWFQQAVKVDPTAYRAYLLKLTYLMPKWHGSREQMFVFAREAASNAPPKTIIPLILADAHREMYYRDDTKEYFKKDPVAWKETKAVYERVTNDFPKSNHYLNDFALTAYRAGDFETARTLFLKIGDQWDPEVWGTKKFFNNVRKKIQEEQTLATKL
ncbi:MAG TPA: DUF4034 domain-containing protein [Candidatus Omnitrophota bacterium]|nr:DUF4034 domain-containing protein [Candidatus Omnitrophota bacterium]